jgi:hypothetical protein
MPTVCSQDQIDSVYFDLSSVFDTVPLNILLHMLSNFDSLPVTLIGFIAILIIDIPLYVFLIRFHSLSLLNLQCPKAPP